MYEAKDYSNLIGISGFSEKLLKNHFTLYNGYVKATNTFSQKLEEMVKSGNSKTPEFAELTRRFGWEFNGMRLHEYYFNSMAKNPSAPNKDSALSRKITEQFGSWENWVNGFKSVAAMKGIGWVILAYDYCRDRLFNIWINEHDAGHLAGANPLLVLDVFEHAFTLDYGINRGEYNEAFFKVINWEKIESRFENASKKCQE